LLKGSLHHNLYEENKKLKDKLAELEDEYKKKEARIDELNNKINSLHHDNELIKCALEINLIELHEKFNDNKINISELLEFVELQKTVAVLEEENEQFNNKFSEDGNKVEFLQKEYERIKIKLENQNIELNSYQEALKTAHSEKLELYQKLDDLDLAKLEAEANAKKFEEDIYEVDKQKQELEEKSRELKHRNEELSKKNMSFLEEYEKIIRENKDLKHNNLEYHELMNTLNQKIQDYEQRLKSKSDFDIEKRVVVQGLYG